MAQCTLAVVPYSLLRFVVVGHYQSEAFGVGLLGCAHNRTHTHTHTHTQTYTHIHKRTHTQHKYANVHTYAHTHTQHAGDNSTWLGGSLQAALPQLPDWGGGCFFSEVGVISLEAESIRW